MLTAAWKKSNKSGNNGACVEVRKDDTHVHVRDSKAPGRGALKYTLVEWDAFLDGAKNGEFDL